MKLELFNLNNLIIFLNKEYLKSINFKIEENVEKEFKRLFLKIKNIYNIDMSGYYEVTVYLNNIYGMIIEIEKDNDEYVRIFSDTVDMKITFKFDSSILYELDSYIDLNIENYNLYYYLNNFYIELLDDDFSYLEYLKLIENSNIIYGNDVRKVKTFSTTIKREKI